MTASNKSTPSLETILNVENRDLSQWSVIWSTSHIPGMDNATGAGPRRHLVGRRRLRLGSLAVGALLTMHCRVAASALTGGVFMFMMFLILAVAALANPLRHFEIYLGQWSISGPGRAFRIIPMLDGIGIAICINAIVRAIYCCSVAAISALYVAHAISDSRLPFTYCRDFDLKSYEPAFKEVKPLMLQESEFAMETGEGDDQTFYDDKIHGTIVGIMPETWRNFSASNIYKERVMSLRSNKRTIAVCNEKYSGKYPPLYSTPAYNFFYVEVVQQRNDFKLGQFNVPLLLSHVCVWFTLWLLMISEKIRHGKIIWNNLYTWFVVIPWIWTVFLVFTAISSLITENKSPHKVFRIGAKELFAAIADALEVGLYIHSVSVGTEMIHGKGLNHYASGHIDPFLTGEVLWHSALLLIVSALHLTGAAGCALVDYVHIQPSISRDYMRESTLWILPMYSKCATVGNYTHFTTMVIFGGLVFSYMTVAFVLLKTALHTIFEYRVKLVFIEQVIVGALIFTCMGLSLIFATNGGLVLLESIDALMSGVAVPLVCALEVTGLLFVYRGDDFLSDLNLSADDSSCVAPATFHWQTIPVFTIIALAVKAYLLSTAELPTRSLLLCLAPLVGVALAVPLRACHNAYVFLKPNPRRGT